MTLATQALARRRVERRGVARVMNGQAFSAATPDTLTTIPLDYPRPNFPPFSRLPELHLRPLVPPLVHRSPMRRIIRALTRGGVRLAAFRTQPHQHLVVTTDTTSFGSTMRSCRVFFARIQGRFALASLKKPVSGSTTVPGVATGRGGSSSSLLRCRAAACGPQPTRRAVAQRSPSADSVRGVAARSCAPLLEEPRDLGRRDPQHRAAWRSRVA